MQHADVHRVITLLTARRLLRDWESERQGMSLSQLIQQANKAWHGVRLHQPDWGDSSHSIAFTAELRKERLLCHLIMNAYWEPLDFELPWVGDGIENSWLRWIDTSLDSPHDIVEWHTASQVLGHAYRVGPRSVVVLFARVGEAASPSL